jgi:hypothetical protein
MNDTFGLRKSGVTSMITEVPPLAYRRRFPLHSHSSGKDERFKLLADDKRAACDQQARDSEDPGRLGQAQSDHQ